LQIDIKLKILGSTAKPRLQITAGFPIVLVYPMSTRAKSGKNNEKFPLKGIDKTQNMVYVINI